MELSEEKKLRVVELNVKELKCENQENGSKRYAIKKERIKNRYHRFLSPSLEIMHFRSIAYKKDIIRRDREEYGVEECTDVFIVLDIFSAYVKKEKVKDIYRDGFYVDDENTSKHYVEYKRNADNAKKGKHIFILEKYYDKMIHWTWMNDKTLLSAIDLKDQEKNDDRKVSLTDAKAYESLVRSEIVGLANIRPEQILVVKDIKHAFKSEFWIADIVRYEKVEEEEVPLDVENKDKEKEEVPLEVENKDKEKEEEEVPLEVEYKDPQSDEAKEIENDVFDGECLIDTEIFEKNTYLLDENGTSSDKAMMLLRNHFFKSCGFRTRIQEYYRDYYKKVSPDIAYDDIKMKDCFGNDLFAKDIRMIVTENSCKFLKFSYLYKKKTEFESKKAVFKAWKKAVEADDCLFGIVKFENESSSDDQYQWTYQMINSMPLSKEQVRSLAQPSVEFYKALKDDLETYKAYVGGKVVERMNELPTSTDMFLLKMLSLNADFSQTTMFKAKRSRDCKAYLNKLRRGKIKIEADYSVLCSMPFELLQWSLIPQGDNKKSLNAQKEWIANLKPVLGRSEVYQADLEEEQEVTLCRNPHVFGGNIVAATNKHVPELDQWFYFGMQDNPRNIIVVSPWEWDIMNALNGADFDSDTVLCIRDDTVNKVVRSIIYYDNKKLFPIPHDATKKAETQKAFYNDCSQLYKVDQKLAGNIIGKIINYSQVLNSYMLNGYLKDLKGKNAIYIANYLQREGMSSINRFYLDQIVKLSVLSGIEIDKAKHVSSINSTEELKRCKPVIGNIDFVYVQEGGIQEGEESDTNYTWYYSESLYDTGTMELTDADTGYRMVLEVDESQNKGLEYPKFMRSIKESKELKVKDAYFDCPMDYLHMYIDEFENDVRQTRTNTIKLGEIFDFEDIQESDSNALFNDVYAVEKILYDEDKGVKAIHKANMRILMNTAVAYDLDEKKAMESDLVFELQKKNMSVQLMKKLLHRIVTKNEIVTKNYSIKPSNYGMIILFTLYKAWPKEFERCVKKQQKR